jgi:hypothetical protein
MADLCLSVGPYPHGHFIGVPQSPDFLPRLQEAGFSAAFIDMIHPNRKAPYGGEKLRLWHLLERRRGMHRVEWAAPGGGYQPGKNCTSRGRWKPEWTTWWEVGWTSSRSLTARANTPSRHGVGGRRADAPKGADQPSE